MLQFAYRNWNSVYVHLLCEWSLFLRAFRFIFLCIQLLLSPCTFTRITKGNVGRIWHGHGICSVAKAYTAWCYRELLLCICISARAVLTITGSNYYRFLCEVVWVVTSLSILLALDRLSTLLCVIAGLKESKLPATKTAQLVLHPSVELSWSSH